MENKEKLIKAFTESLGIEPQLVTDELTYNTIPQWDSTAHMVLLVELENVFDVIVDTDEIIDLSSVAQAKIILQKYDDSIEFA